MNNIGIGPPKKTGRALHSTFGIAFWAFYKVFFFQDWKYSFRTWKISQIVIWLNCLWLVSIKMLLHLFG